jgi:hypothetical protein
VAGRVVAWTCQLGGLLYDTGTIVVERGGALERGAGATPSVSFAGSNVIVTLDQRANVPVALRATCGSQ